VHVGYFLTGIDLLVFRIRYLRNVLALVLALVF
jgi:hypothetical protein